MQYEEVGGQYNLDSHSLLFSCPLHPWVQDQMSKSASLTTVISPVFTEVGIHKSPKHQYTHPFVSDTVFGTREYVVILPLILGFCADFCWRVLW